MVELGELEARQEDFTRRHARVLVASLDNLEDSRATQQRFPHLSVVADSDGRLIDAAGARHPHAGPQGIDAAAPMTALIDKNGTVRWLYRPDRFSDRLTPDELLAEVDRHLSQ